MWDNYERIGITSNQGPKWNELLPTYSSPSFPSPAPAPVLAGFSFCL